LAAGRERLPRKIRRLLLKHRAGGVGSANPKSALPASTSDMITLGGLVVVWNYVRKATLKENPAVVSRQAETAAIWERKRQKGKQS
jgi:hypothetical protein